VKQRTGSAVFQGGEVALEPCDVDHIQVVSRLIKEKNVSLEEHGPCECKLHLPTTGQTADCLLLALIAETDGGKGLDDLLFISEDARIGQDELEHRRIGLATVDVVFDIEGTDLVGRWEALDLAIGNGPHEGRLASTVFTAETVTVATLETESGSVEKDLGTVGERELAVAEVFAFLLIFRYFIVIIARASGANNPLPSDGGRVGRRSNEGQVGCKSLPLGNVKVLGIYQVCGQARNIDNSDIRGSRSARASLLVDGGKG
jgi:hypothetical protein